MQDLSHSSFAFPGADSCRSGSQAAGATGAFGAAPYPPAPDQIPDSLVDGAGRYVTDWACPA